MKLRKLMKKDAPLILEWMKDPQINRFFRFEPDNTNTSTVQAFVDEAQKEDESFHLACVDDSDEYLLMCDKEVVEV